MAKKETEKIIQYLKEISEIPRASGDEKAISDYLLKFAKDRGLEAWQDAKGNFYAKKPAHGKESGDAIILQGHMDLVYVKTEDCPYKYEEGIKVLEDKDYLWADGTSLGADNGIAVAYCMALMDAEDIEHPDLEFIITVEEEIGLIGAKESDLSNFKGDKLLNLDSEEEGVFTVGCAGGYRASMFWDATKEALAKEEYTEVLVELWGLKGGHSGVNIHLGRANAIQLAGRMLHFMNQNYEYRIGEIYAPGKENIISHNLKMSLYVKAEEADQICAKLSAFGPVFANEYSASDTVNLKVEKKEEKTKAEAYPSDLNKRLTAAILLIPNGVLDFSMKIANLVETSMNMGAIEIVDGRLHLLSSVRSSVSTRKKFLQDKLRIIGEHYADEVQFLYEYPEWEYKEESKLRDVACESYHTIFGRDAKVETIHAGLECGYFYMKNPNLDIISMGPDLWDVHSTEEKVSKKSIARTWGLVKEILHNL
ncbi:MAG: beta-Ala-His dipeptidase [Dorea sp.]